MGLHADIAGVFFGCAPDVVQRAIPWLALLAGDVDFGAAPELVPHFERLAQRAGLQEQMSVEERTCAIEAFYVAHPLPAVLMVRVYDLLRDESREAGTALARSAARLGIASSNRPMTSTKAAVGSIAAGPLARASLHEHPRPQLQAIVDDGLQPHLLTGKDRPTSRE